jgi:hypothetical protein
VGSLVRLHTYLIEIHIQFSPWKQISCGRVGTKILMSWRRVGGRRGWEISIFVSRGRYLVTTTTLVWQTWHL